MNYKESILLRFQEMVIEFVTGLLKYAKITHAGNCLIMSKVVKEYLEVFCYCKADIINVQVQQDEKMINHYCLETKAGYVIDPTASQFKGMPQVYFGKLPINYHHKKKIST